MGSFSIKDSFKRYVMLLSRFHEVLYCFLCGEFPRLRPWHFQWHAFMHLDRDLKKVLPFLTGDILDMGCGDGPYRSLFRSADSYIGADIEDGPNVDTVLVPEAPMPFEDNFFDAVICTQVFEHVADLEFSISEIKRILKPGGQLVASVPFIYQLHGIPHDYRRLSEYGATQLLADFDLQKIYRQGAIGSSLAILSLGWIHTQLNSNVLTGIAKIVLLPLWVPFCLLVNVCALLLDYVDTTKSVYSNVLIVARLS